jgi:hypothetical protein
VIRFFRRIRFNLLRENRFTRYLLYAIGEIVLVVIGILIALNINNRIELQKNERVTRLALEEIQKNLLEDIINAQHNLKAFIKSDSIQNKIFDFKNPSKPDDYKNNEVQKLGHLYYDFVINKNGYENLLRHLDKLPGKYKPILEDLNELYVNMNENITVSNERIRNTVYAHLDFLHDQNWDIHRLKYNEISQEEINYYLNDDAYKKQVRKFMNDRWNVFKNSHRFRVKAVGTYIKIDSLLEKQDSELPYHLLGIIRSKREVEPYLGTYKFEDTTIPYSVKVQYKDHYLLSSDSQGFKAKHFRFDGKRFMYTSNDFPIVWEINKSKDGSIAVEFINIEQPDLIKVN